MSWILSGSHVRDSCCNSVVSVNVLNWQQGIKDEGFSNFMWTSERLQNKHVHKMQTGKITAADICLPVLTSDSFNVAAVTL